MSVARQTLETRRGVFAKRPSTGADPSAPPSVTRGRGTTGACFATVAIYDTVEGAARAWAALDAVAICSPYQTRAWIDGWMETEGRASGIRPMIAVAEDASGRPLGLLPLGVRRRGVIRQACFLGGRETNYNMGLFDPSQRWTPRDAALFLRDAARICPLRVDLYLLVNQPVGWEGFANPLATLRHQPSPSFGHRAVLQPDGEAFLRAHLSAAARKKLRTKAAALAAMGPVSHRVARTPAEIAAVLTAHIVQKTAKLAALGIAPPDEAALRRLLDRACLGADGAAAPVELHALWCGDTVVATFGGLARAGRFSGLLISYAADPPLARTSPGDLLLAAVIRGKCDEGFRSFDLGIGEARYKEAYCPLPDPLVDTVLPLTVAGHATAAAVATSLRAKSVIKRSPALWAAARALRRTLAPLRRSGG